MVKSIDGIMDNTPRSNSSFATISGFSCPSWASFRYVVVVCANSLKSPLWLRANAAKKYPLIFSSDFSSRISSANIATDCK